MNKYGKYELGNLLGQGSYGQVFKAYNVETREIAALKLIPKVAHNTKQLQDIRTELEIHSQLNHRNIIKLIDYYESDRELVLITECAKFSLAELIRPRTNPSYERIQQIACEITSALFYLHTRRILHRDLKPQNVLVGHDDVTKLCDFGFAKDMAVDTFLLTSVKGTPLYMAPEIIDRKPYDHKTDLWSFGCILYELLVGFPPYNAIQIYELFQMLKQPIKWDLRIKGDCLTFLRGLLERESQKRFDWPEILEHPYVCKGVVYNKEEIGEYALTKPLSPSQEFAKQSERRRIQHMQNLTGTKRISNFFAPTNGIPRRLPPSNLVIVQNGKIVPAQQTRTEIRTNQNFVTNGDTENHLHPKHDLNASLHHTAVEDETAAQSSDSSLDTLTSSSEDESEDEKATVVVESGSSPKSMGSRGNHISDSFKQSTSDPWISGTRLALGLHGENDPIEIEEEWLDYLHKNIKEVIRNPESLCEKYSFRLIVQPLRNQYTGVVVVDKIGFLLSLPFALESKEPALLRNLESVYLDSKVVANLIYACKLIVIRRRLENGGGDGHQILGILTENDIDAMDKCLRLVCFLVHSEQRFVVQFCDSILGFQASVLFKLFLRLDKRRCQITSDALAILCHLMRTLPANFNMLEEILIEQGSGEELWRLIAHTDAGVQSCALRIVGYLLVHSEKIRDLFLQRNLARLWGCLRNASTKSEPRIASAAEFVSETLRHLESPAPPTHHTQRQFQQSSLPLKF